MFEIVATASIMFREGFEAMLLTTLLVGLQQNSRIGLASTAIGASVGLISSLLVGYLIANIGFDLEDYGWTLSLITALVLTYVVTMNARVSKHVNDHVRDISAAPGWAIILAVAAIFLREGMEVVLMLYGMAMSAPYQVAAGVSVGLFVLFGLGFIMRNEILARFGIGKTMFLSNIILAAMAVFFYAQAYFGYFYPGH